MHEIGKAIHPALARGQIEGGTAQGIGYALLEEVVMRDGAMANAQLTNYIIPDDARHAADGRGHRWRTRTRDGPFGAKGVGEMPIDGPAPAVVNAHPPPRRSTCARFRRCPSSDGGSMRFTLNGQRGRRSTRRP